MKLSRGVGIAIVVVAILTLVAVGVVVRKSNLIYHVKANISGLGKGQQQRVQVLDTTPALGPRLISYEALLPSLGPADQGELEAAAGYGRGFLVHGDPSNEASREQFDAWLDEPRQKNFAFVENVRPITASFDSGTDPIIRFAFTETNGNPRSEVNRTVTLTLSRERRVFIIGGPKDIYVVTDASFYR